LKELQAAAILRSVHLMQVRLACGSLQHAALPSVS
jgi:hypothetical protein